MQKVSRSEKLRDASVTCKYKTYTFVLCRYTFSIYLVEFSHQPVLRTTSVHNELKQQCDGAGEYLKNEKLRVAWYGLGNTRARRTLKRAPKMYVCTHTYVC